jgi:hypothetical protein
VAVVDRIKRRSRRSARWWLELTGPTIVAFVFALVYVIVRPTSLDLADHLFRAQLFRDEGFSVWNNFWYSGHDIPGYSVFFPAVSAALTPQDAAALAAVLTAAVATPLMRRHFGAHALAGGLLFGAATAIDLFTGRLAFAFGAFPALAAILLLDYGWWPAACVLAAFSGLGSPVAALFAALIGAGYGLGEIIRHRRLLPALPGAAVAVAALVPVGILSILFPEGGTEPFGLATMLPILVVTVVAIALLPREQLTLRSVLFVYAVALLGVWLIPSPIGSNISRLGTLVCAPVAAIVFWQRRALVLVAIVPLLYLGWEAPVRDLSTSSNDSSVSQAYYRPLLRFLHHTRAASASPFRIEIPFTYFHWEAYVVASHFAIARGWERQLDIHDNAIFYRSGALTPATYQAWLHANAVRFVAVPDAKLDYSATAEMTLIDSGLPYLHLVRRFTHWRIYAVAHATPIADGPATLTGLGPDWLTLRVRRPGTVLVHVRFTPYWAITRGSGCVAPEGAWTRLEARHAGTYRLATRFSLSRVRATSPRCT